jgi:hypothetical protein
MGVFIWTFDIISHLGSNSSFTITNNFRKFQVMILFSWMSWMSTMTKMTFISISDMHIVSFVKKYNLPIRRLWVHTPQTYVLWVWQKGWHGILPFFVLPSHEECSLRVGCNCERWICISTLCYFSSKGGIFGKIIND